VEAVLQEEQQSPGVFSLTVEALQRLNRTTRRVENVLPYFELRMAAELGFAPLIHKEEVEELRADGGYLAFDNGSITGARAGSQSSAGSRKALRAFAIFASADADTVQRMSLDQRTLSEVEHLVESYMKYHLEESYPDRSRKVIDQMTM
ncbi:MAG: DNA repair protein RecO C-terminal domain-containing protein, partial [Rhodothermales bacterium]|nr:DNA repair protein RecO C-terminal domain-containing protein [Rhodothermales bacterium]